MAGLMEGKVALVTGGSSGIGKATALAFAREGASVVIANRTQETGEEVAQAIQEMGGQAVWIQTDVSQADQVEAMIEGTLRAFGRLDYAFNNAGSGGMGGWLADIPEAEFDKTINGFLKSVWLCMKHEIPVMLKSGGGSIVNNSSVDGLRAFPYDPVYSAAKHGVIGLTRSGAMQYANQGIRINAVCPGWIRTPPVENILQNSPEAKNGMLQHQPIGRLGAADEVAEAVVWLCSDKASLIIGVAFPVDGGYTVV
ncbi:MAG: glucose 1-dehydrogenase [Anaerolineae bacterium]|nr:glucose 1-dehydrogenase [Anaerolineae bacterium]